MRLPVNSATPASDAGISASEGGISNTRDTPTPQDEFRFARPYQAIPAWAHSSVTAPPTPPSADGGAEPTAAPSDLSPSSPRTHRATSLAAALGGKTTSSQLFLHPLKPQDYRASSTFVQQVVNHLLETVDRRRPFAHLRGLTTPEIMDIVEQFSTARAGAIMALAGPSLTSPGLPAMQPAPLRLLRLHLRARRLSPQESAEARAAERNLPPGYHGALRPGQASTVKPSSAITAEADLRVEICGTYRDDTRVKAFAGAAERRESQWRLITFNFI